MARPNDMRGVDETILVLGVPSHTYEPRRRVLFCPLEVASEPAHVQEVHACEQCAACSHPLDVDMVRADDTRIPVRMSTCAVLLLACQHHDIRAVCADMDDILAASDIVGRVVDVDDLM